MGPQRTHAVALILVPDPDPPTVPATVRLAAALVAVEALGVLGYTVVQLSRSADGRVALAASTGLFFGIYGCALVVAARALWRLEGWARGFVLVTQLVQLGIAWSLRGDPTTPAAILLAALAAVILAVMLSPPTTAAFDD
jgi:hypothetical protein